MANPDKGVLAEIFQPAITRFTATFFELRGVERIVTQDGADAAVVQEWRVVIVATLPEDQRPFSPAVPAHTARGG